MVAAPESRPAGDVWTPVPPAPTSAAWISSHRKITVLTSGSIADWGSGRVVLRWHRWTSVRVVVARALARLAVPMAHPAHASSKPTVGVYNPSSTQGTANAQLVFGDPNLIGVSGLFGLG